MIDIGVSLVDPALRHGVCHWLIYQREELDGPFVTRHQRTTWLTLFGVTDGVDYNSADTHRAGAPKRANRLARWRWTGPRVSPTLKKARKTVLWASAKQLAGEVKSGPTTS